MNQELRSKTVLSFTFLLGLSVVSASAASPPAVGRPGFVVLKIDKDVRHPDTKQQVRVKEIRAIIQMLPNAKSESLVDASIMLDTGAQGQGNPHRLGGACRTTIPRAKELPRQFPISCPVYFLSEKQHGRTPGLIVMGDLIELHGGMLNFSVRNIVTQ